MMQTIMQHLNLMALSISFYSLNALSADAFPPTLICKQIFIDAPQSSGEIIDTYMFDSQSNKALLWIVNKNGGGSELAKMQIFFDKIGGASATGFREAATTGEATMAFTIFFKALKPGETYRASLFNNMPGSGDSLQLGTEAKLNCFKMK